MGKGYILLTYAVAIAALGQAPEATTIDVRLPSNTLVREDVFAGIMNGDLARLSDGEKTVDYLLEHGRATDRSGLLAWKGSITLYRAVLAREQNKEGEWDSKYKQALDLFAEAKRMTPDDIGVNAQMGISFLLLNNRLPEAYRASANSAAYEAYQVIRRVQPPKFEKMPVHEKGEVLSGMAESALRTGHSEEAQKYLDEIIRLVPDSPYAVMANKWKQNPELVGSTHLVCQTCHEPGRLAAKRAALAR
jgi:tetratricopeptide (TPR) repeat protein